MTASPTTLQHALTESLSSGIFIDTKIYGFSTRKSDDHVGGLKALYANSHVLRRVPYFDALLSGGFSEGNTTNIRSNDEVLLLNKDVSWCGYSSDSDLEDDLPESTVPSGHDETTIDDVSASNLFPSDQIQTFPPNSLDPNSFLSSQWPSHSPPQMYHSAEPTDESGDTSQDVETMKLETRQPSNPQSSTEHIQHLGKVVVIQNAAFATLQALVMYLYTGEIEFAPFRSGENRKSRKLASLTTPDYNKMPKSSPKSIYRLANKFIIPDLKDLAYRHICANLSKCDIVEELFSRFTSYYTEILDTEVQHFANILQAGSNPTISANLDKKIELYAKGKLPHASEAFNALFNVLWDEDKNLGLAAVQELDKHCVQLEPVQPLGPACCGDNKYLDLRFEEDVAPEPICPSKNALKTALNKSMTTGTFLDLLFYARRRSSSRMNLESCCPIYFSGMIVEEWLGKIEECTMKLDATTGDATVDEVVGDSEQDSDFDEEQPCFSKATVKTDDIKDADISTPMHRILEHPAFDDDVRDAVFFRVGAATTWKALLFYIYTDHVSFSLLNSQGRETQIKTQHGQPLHQPKPCSPKSLYTLAHKLGLDSLRELASKDIERKISAINIVTEFFSRFTSSHKEILAMEERILGEQFRNPETGNEISKIIRTMLGGKASHRSIALQSVFQRIIVREPLVGLRCKYCRPGILHGLSDLSRNLCCPRKKPHQVLYVNCGSCGSQRKTDTRTCLNCRARFRS